MNKTQKILMFTFFALAAAALLFAKTMPWLSGFLCGVFLILAVLFAFGAPRANVIEHNYDLMIKRRYSA